MTESLHNERFPNESREYREARSALLLEERELRRHIERVAAQRRALPPGGEIPQDYEFEEIVGDGEKRTKLSELFGPHSSLIVYSFMFSPKEGARPCPSCTSILDGLDGQFKHVTQRASLAVVGRAAANRIRDFARERGWRDLRLLSSARNNYNADYRGETKDGSQNPALNVFTRRDGKIFHTWCSELLFAPFDPGQHGRHVDLFWPLWNLLDVTPEGRGTDWGPKLHY